MNIPAFIKELSIVELSKEELPLDLDKDLLNYDVKIFELKSQEKKYYIIAGNLLIGKNKWLHQDRIFNFNQNLEHEEIVFSTN